ncbi:hypothetical protein C9374_006589 [Naegleria lovaniensis]|uniref:Uncharacterized protein n=1 Tax=Naegleria lovaniensis TaxID=51637 RepID=A0AA88GL93_NAELO|nr:uncharacterized protein C9374_006589 [Naegleria lovaniensis]KAG2379472.1 hypothetical protein C9374_006589 [Naegleria lovaniensis]
MDQFPTLDPIIYYDSFYGDQYIETLEEYSNLGRNAISKIESNHDPSTLTTMSTTQFYENVLERNGRMNYFLTNVNNLSNEENDFLQEENQLRYIMEQYEHCTPLARLWIFKDLKDELFGNALKPHEFMNDIHAHHSRQNESIISLHDQKTKENDLYIISNVLKELALDCQMEIFHFIPTYSQMEHLTKSSLQQTNHENDRNGSNDMIHCHYAFSFPDIWWSSWMKLRLISKSVKLRLEHSKSIFF